MLLLRLLALLLKNRSQAKQNNDLNPLCFFVERMSVDIKNNLEQQRQVKLLYDWFDTLRYFLDSVT